MKRKFFWMLGIFGIALILFAIFTTQMHFHDSIEYINLAKNLGGVQNINIFSCHSGLYPGIISLFLKIFPNDATIRIVNVFWILAIGITLLLWLKNKFAFLIFAFSPLSWYMSIQTTPVLPASLCFLLAYIFFLKKEIKLNRLFSGFFLGLAFAFYTPAGLFALLFVLIYFWDKSLLETMVYGISCVIGFLPRLIFDFYLFGNPFYSLIRFIGVNAIMTLNLHTSYAGISLFTNLGILGILFAISPFLFRLYRINFRKHARVLTFIGLVGLIVVFRVPAIKYFLLISPIICLLLSKVLTKNEIKLHCILSIILILFLTQGFFYNDLNWNQDLKNISSEYNVDYIIGGPLKAPKLAMLSWEDSPYFVYYADFEASIKNETLFREYVFEFDSKNMPLKDKFAITGSFSRYENKSYENYIIVSSKDKPIENREIIKCYEVLCVYEK